MIVLVGDETQFSESFAGISEDPKDDICQLSKKISEAFKILASLRVQMVRVARGKEVEEEEEEEEEEGVIRKTNKQTNKQTKQQLHMVYCYRTTGSKKSIRTLLLN